MNTHPRFEEDPDAEQASISKYHLRSIEKRHNSLTPSSQKHLKKKNVVLLTIHSLLPVLTVKTTSHEAMHIIAPALKAAGVNIDCIVLSTSTIYRARKTVRKSLIQTQKELFVITRH
jgi:hypothetical protein